MAKRKSKVINLEGEPKILAFRRNGQLGRKLCLTRASSFETIGGRKGLCIKWDHLSA